MTTGTILTIEDDAAIRRGIVDALTFVGYRVLEAANGTLGMELATTSEYDLLLLDLVLPDASGFEILTSVRSTRPTQPVICLTACGDEHDRVTGLNLGADDYVVKPFGVRELVARVEAVLRRSPTRGTTVEQINIPAGDIDLNRCEVQFHDGERLELSERERELVRYLVQNAGRCVTRKELLANVWGISPRGVSTRTIDMHVARLREKLRDNPSQPAVLVTVRGRGYMWGAANVASAEDAQP